MSNQYKVSELCELVQGELVGDSEILVSRFKPIDMAEIGDISFISGLDKLDLLEKSKASVVIAPEKIEGNYSCCLIKVADPYLAEAKIHSFLLAEDFLAEGVHKMAFVDEDCDISAQITIKAMACIGKRVKIGERVKIESGVVIGDDVIIGDDCHLAANVTIAKGCEIGSRVVIDSGTVIGSEGFGYATDKMGFHFKRPQIGIVRLGDDVEIGSNNCIDRATYGATLIKSGVKIDNHVQIGHNVEVGENSIIVSKCGIAGSTTLGRNVVMGARAAAIDHLKIGDQVMMAAGSGALSDIEAKSVVGGIPAVPIRQWKKNLLLGNRLPEMNKDIKQLKRDLAKIMDSVISDSK
ncbi:MAG: UDP-3-O-(3-hydroxymyristoyl)glucosamine N-acyltransferase [Desulfotalea sp.]